MRRAPLWLLLAGAVLVVVGVLLQAFSIAAFVRGAGPGALDMHKDVADFVHVGEILVAVGAIWAWWGRWTAVGIAVGWIVLSVLQLVAVGDTDKPGGWVNGLHGLLALVLLVGGLLYGQRAARELGFRERLS
jgi:peptidoglycan/LPS O-acetylase OafA/YrhL